MISIGNPDDANTLHLWLETDRDKGLVHLRGRRGDDATEFLMSFSDGDPGRMDVLAAGCQKLGIEVTVGNG